MNQTPIIKVNGDWYLAARKLFDEIDIENQGPFAQGIADAHAESIEPPRSAKRVELDAAQEKRLAEYFEGKT